MAIDLVKLEYLFDQKKYTSLLKMTSSDWKKSDFYGHEKLFFMYVFSCYYDSRPRKLDSAIRLAYEASLSPNLIMNLLEVSLSDHRDEVVEKIYNISHEKGDRHHVIGVKMIILKAIITKRRAIKAFDSTSVSDLISETLNSDIFYQSEESEELLSSLENRIKKHYRNNEYERITLWLDDVLIRDENFGALRFLFLSFWKMKSLERCKKLCRMALLSINKHENLEVILDIQYTISDFNGIINAFEGRNQDSFSFKSRFILARALRKTGNISRAREILNEAKKSLEDQILAEEIEAIKAIRDIKQIGIFGDVGVSERLLSILSSSAFYSKSIESNGHTMEFVDLVKDTLDRQKRLRVNEVIESAELFIRAGKYQRAFSDIFGLINHGITHSTKLIELYIITAYKTGNRHHITDLIRDNAGKMEGATVEKIAEILERQNMYAEFRTLCQNVSIEASDSKKFLRSYFNVLNRDLDFLPPKELLIKISKKKNPNNDSIVYFITRYLEYSSPLEVKTLLDTLKVEKKTRIFCSVKILNSSKDTNMIQSIAQDILTLEIDQSSSSIFTNIIVEFCNICHRVSRDDLIIKITENFGYFEEYHKKISPLIIRSLIAKSEYEIAYGMIQKFEGSLSPVQRWRFLLGVGKIPLVEHEIDSRLSSDVGLTTSEMSGIESIFFRVGRFHSYLEMTRVRILDGDFNLSDLTKQYFSLYKLGRDEQCMKIHSYLKRHYSQDPEKRAILAIAGYDFDIDEDFFQELELAVLAKPEDIKILTFIAQEFIKLERIDIAYFFVKKGLIISQVDPVFMHLAKKIQLMMFDLSINPTSISADQIVRSPIYTDVEVIRGILDHVPQNNPKHGKRFQDPRVAIQSHTLDIGGAERQATLLIKCLDEGLIQNASFSLITNKIPTPAEIDRTYHRDLPKNLKIIEYHYNTFKQNEEGGPYGLIDYLSETKANRLKNLIEIYNDGNYDIAHIWQDYCNIYGGIAAVFSGCESVIMSARTLPPPGKGALARRQGRSYKECYKLLLERQNVIITHNSDYGNENYCDWLGIAKEKSVTIHNGLDTTKWKMREKNSGIRRSLGIPSESTIIGTVGRLTTDKRPWLFLKVAENLLLRSNEARSSELEQWYFLNEGANSTHFEKVRMNADPQDIHFVMVGDGPQFETAKKIVEGSNTLAGRVHLVGFSSDIGTYLSEFDWFLLVSKVEGLPNALIEAQSFGVPVISTNAGGAIECFIPEETGVLLDDDSPFFISETITKLLKSGQMKNAAKKLGHNFIEAKFGINAYTNKISELYRGGPN